MSGEYLSMLVCLACALFCGICAKNRLSQWKAVTALKVGATIETSRGALAVIEEISGGIVTLLCTKSGPRSNWEVGEIYTTFLSDAKKYVEQERWKVSAAEKMDPELILKVYDPSGKKRTRA